MVLKTIPLFVYEFFCFLLLAAPDRLGAAAYRTTLR